MIQRDRVLQMLRDAGPAGVHTFELRSEYIGNPSQRIAELEEAGHAISHERERLHGQAVGTRYRLVKLAATVPPDVAAPAPAPPPPATGAGATPLFDLTFDDVSPPPRSAIYGDAA